MPKTKRAAGCVVYHRTTGGGLRALLIHDRYGQWTLPKGHLEAGESDAQAAEREVFEETGIRGQLGVRIGQIEYSVLSKKGQPQLKQVSFFLMHSAETTVTPQADEGIRAAEWFTPEQALAKVGYSQLRGVLAQAFAMLGLEHEQGDKVKGF